MFLQTLTKKLINYNIKLVSMTSYLMVEFFDNYVISRFPDNYWKKENINSINNDDNDLFKTALLSLKISKSKYDSF